MPSSVGADGFRAYTPVPQYPIASVDHALKIILMLGERSDIRFSQVAEQLGVAPSTARRLLAILQYRGFARPNPGHTTCGPGETWTGLVSSVLRRFDIRTTLRPFIEKLNAELRETVHVGVRDGAVIRFVDALESRRAVRVTSRLGRIVPAHCTSTGKAILAQLDPTDLRRLYPDDGLPGLTARSIRRRSELEAELAAVRWQGYAISREESEEGVSSVAVAIPPGVWAPAVAVTVSVPAGRLGPGQIRRIVTALTTVGTEINELLHSWPCAFRSAVSAIWISCPCTFDWSVHSD